MCYHASLLARGRLSKSVLYCAVSMIEFAPFHVAPESLALENPQMLVVAVETLVPQQHEEA